MNRDQFEDKRFGRFTVSEVLLKERPEAIRALMQRVFITSCRHNYAAQKFEYYALCNDLPCVEYGRKIPYYNVLFDEGLGGIIDISFVEAAETPESVAG